jgi:hypothetical protein
MLKKRKPVEFGKGLKAIGVDWKKILRDREQSFLTDNQLSVFFDKQNPGCERTHFYPLPFAHQFTGGKWDTPELVNHDSFRSTGPKLDFVSKKTLLSFCPHQLVKTMSAGKSRIVERSCVTGNVLLIEWTVTGLKQVTLNYALPHFDAEVWEFKQGLCASVKNQAFAALAFAGVKDVVFETKEQPFECKAVVTLTPGKKVLLAVAYGYDEAGAVNIATKALKNPRAVFAAAEKTWNHYFTRIVPRFECSDKRLEKLYYYQAYTTRANLYDIPYEPFTRPYTCPWKTGAVWQWSWNTPMNSICERWLNDKQIGSGGILLEGDNGGGLNIGTYLHSTVKIKKLRDHNEGMRLVGKYLKKLPPKIDLPIFTTIPHTTPNGLLGAWEFYLGSGDKIFLRRALDIMKDAEGHFSKHELPSGLCTTMFVDEFDYSLRLKPFIKAFKKGDPEMMCKMDTPFIAIDYNCYLYALRQKMIEAAKILGDNLNIKKLQAQNEKLKAGINRYLWSDKEGYYFDVDPRTMKHSNVKCLQAFSALYAGIATQEQAARMVKRLTNPKEFATPYPCPSVAMDTPGVDPALITYGGDIEITSGLWFTVEALVRYGYTALAAKYIIQAVKMVAKEGPSSSYSYHSLTGKYNQGKHELAAQCAILTDLICKYIIGINPKPGGKFDLNPIALPASGIKAFTFGPYTYCGKSLTVTYEKTNGLKVKTK